MVLAYGKIRGWQWCHVVNSTRTRQENVLLMALTLDNGTRIERPTAQATMFLQRLGGTLGLPCGYEQHNCVAGLANAQAYEATPRGLPLEGREQLGHPIGENHHYIQLQVRASKALAVNSRQILQDWKDVT